MKEKVISLLSELKNKGLSQAAIARELSLSPSTISLLGKGSCKSDNLHIYARGMENILKRYENTVSNENENVFEPKFQKRASILIRQATDNHVLGLLVGQSGSGKSYVCETATKDSRVIKVKMRMSLTVKGIVDTILNAIEVKHTSGNVTCRFNFLVKALKQSGIKVIIIDEADMFCRDSKEQFIKKFEILRELYEAGFSVILVGLSRLSEKLKDVGEDYINRRVKLSYPMRLTIDDISSFYDFLGLPDSSLKAGIIDCAYNNGNLGVIKNIYEQYSLFRDIRLASELVFTTQSV